MLDSDARVLERLLQDPEFRARFQDDPAAAAREAGLEGLAVELELGDPIQTPEPPQSRASLPGVFLSRVLQGVGVYEGGQHLLPPVGEAYAAAPPGAQSEGWTLLPA